VADIFDEVEEDLRADRARRLARQWGGILVGVALAALAVTGGVQGWRWWQAKEAAAAAATYLNLHRSSEQGGDLRDAANGFSALAREAPAGYATLARLRAAALLAEAGDTAGALALWDQVAADAAADRLYRDLATLLAVGHGLDAGDPAQLAARIAPLTEAGNPWQALARETSALVAIRRGDTAGARQILQALATDVTVSPGLRERAQRVAAGLRG
jgi:hypothetical protein